MSITFLYMCVMCVGMGVHVQVGVCLFFTVCLYLFLCFSECFQMYM